jgi:CheY-like chemotaxis protein
MIVHCVTPAKVTVLHLLLRTHLSAHDPAPRGTPSCYRRLLGSVDGASGSARSGASVHLKAAAMSADGRQPHILIINDTQEILDLMRELLEEEGYRVTTSLALLDIDKVKALGPDIIVQDLLFEGTQELGWKFLTLVRLDPALARIPLVLCTAAVRTVNDPVMAEQLDQKGIRVVLKPFTIEDLLTTLNDVRTAQSLIDQATAGRED